MHPVSSSTRARLRAAAPTPVGEAAAAGRSTEAGRTIDSLLPKLNAHNSRPLRPGERLLTPLPPKAALGSRVQRRSDPDETTTLPIDISPKGAPDDGPLVRLVPLPKALRPDFDHVLGWHDHLIDDALAHVRSSLLCDLGRHDKGKGRQVVLSGAIKARMSRLAYAFTPRDTWNFELPFYVGALQFIINVHGPLGLNLVEDAAFFLRLPMVHKERVKNLFSIGLMPPEAVMTMRPMMQFCIDHGIKGAALIDIFERLGTCVNPVLLAKRMMNAVQAPGHDLLCRLEPRVLELWMFIATELPHESQDDVPWAAFAGKAMLSNIVTRVNSGHADSDSLDIDMNLLRETLSFSHEHRMGIINALMPLLHADELPYPIAATVLQLFALHGEAVRDRAQAWLKQTRFRAQNPQHLLLGVFLASQQAFHTVNAPREPKA